MGSVSFWALLEDIRALAVLWECTKILLLITMTLDKSQVRSLKEVMFLWVYKFTCGLSYNVTALETGNFSLSDPETEVCFKIHILH